MTKCACQQQLGELQENVANKSKSSTPHRDAKAMSISATSCMLEPTPPRHGRLKLKLPAKSASSHKEPTDGENEAIQHKQRSSDKDAMHHATAKNTSAPSETQENASAQEKRQGRREVMMAERPKPAWWDNPLVIKTGLAVALQSAAYQSGPSVGRPRCVFGMNYNAIPIL